MPRFFAEITSFPEAVIQGRKSVSHITGPLRKRLGDELPIRAGNHGYRAVISSIGSDRIVLEIIREETLRDRGNTVVSLAVCLFDLKDLDDTIRCTTELGVSGIYPVISARSNIRSVTEARRARWEAIILEAVKQCDRMSVPVLHKPLTLEVLVNEVAQEWATRLVALKDAQRPISEYRGRDAGILVGPEGGFSPEEEQEISRCGFIPVSLGNTTLRATTAAIAVLSILG